MKRFNVRRILNGLKSGIYVDNSFTNIIAQECIWVNKAYMSPETFSEWFMKRKSRERK